MRLARIRIKIEPDVRAARAALIGGIEVQPAALAVAVQGHFPGGRERHAVAASGFADGGRGDSKVGGSRCQPD